MKVRLTRDVFLAHRLLLAKHAREDKHKHLAYVARERKFVESERFRIQAHSDDLYFEIDGMDQSKTNLPHWPNTPKDVNKDLLQQIHVSAVRYADDRPADIYMLQEHLRPRLGLYMHNHLQHHSEGRYLLRLILS